MHMMNFLFANSSPCLPKQSKKCPPFSVLAFALWNWSQWILLGLVLEGDERAEDQKRSEYSSLIHSIPALYILPLLQSSLGAFPGPFLWGGQSTGFGNHWTLSVSLRSRLPTANFYVPYHPLLILVNSPFLKLGIFECPICFLSFLWIQCPSLWVSS